MVHWFALLLSLQFGSHDPTRPSSFSHPLGGSTEWTRSSGLEQRQIRKSQGGPPEQERWLWQQGQSQAHPGFDEHWRHIRWLCPRGTGSQHHGPDVAGCVQLDSSWSGANSTWCTSPAVEVGLGTALRLHHVGEPQDAPRRGGGYQESRPLSLSPGAEVFWAGALGAAFVWCCAVYSDTKGRLEREIVSLEFACRDYRLPR